MNCNNEKYHFLKKILILNILAKFKINHIPVLIKTTHYKTCNQNSVQFNLQVLSLKNLNMTEIEIKRSVVLFSLIKKNVCFTI